MSAQANGVNVGDTKNKRKFETKWGVFYLPLELVAELGNPDEITFTVEAKS
jgi:hypothetical protein